MRTGTVLAAVLAALLVASAYADCYMHNPRGSNDRNREQNGNRQNANRLFDSQNNAAGGYAWAPNMYYYVGSTLPISWTAQHGCGKTQQCEFIIQYMCGSDMRDGTTTTTIPDNAAGAQDPQYGMHESYNYYQDCKARRRNGGLFIADRNVGTSARNTRQNNGGTRRGFECPEERDYYPYWHPSPWVDVAVITSNITRCDLYKEESQNVKEKNECSEAKHNNKKDCEAAGATWKVVAPHDVPAPECVQAENSDVNQLGLTHTGRLQTYDWVIPEEMADKNCAIRLRYNISISDMPWELDSKSNKAASPIKQDQMVQFGNHNLSLAVNTNQISRTFQDRSFMFSVKALPEDLKAAVAQGRKIVNLNVRGKRGNIVQTYPATEYFFTGTEARTNEVIVKQDDYIHFQWTGSNFNPQRGNNNGEGTERTDRSNLVQRKDMLSVKPLNEPSSDFFEDEATRNAMAYPNQPIGDDTKCLSYEALKAKYQNKNDREQAEENCMKLNADTEGYFDGGVIKVNNTGESHFVSTRNNNFSNRDHTVTILVEPRMPAWAWVAIGLGSGVVAMSGAAIGYTKVTGNALPFM